MYTIAEGDVMAGRPADVERVGVVEGALVPVGRRAEDVDALPRPDQMNSTFEIR